MKYIVEIQLLPGSLTCHEAWNAVLPWFVETYGKSDLQLNNEYIELDAIGEAIERTQIREVDVSDENGLLVNLGDNTLAGIYQVCLFQIPEKGVSSDSLIERMPAQDLICARLYAFEYEKWQSKKDIGAYDRSGRSHDHLLKYWDANLDKERIDISKNPGRWDIRNGKCIEAIGSPMWIGPLFQERTGGDWRGMQDYDWCEITELGNGVVRLTSWDGPFDSDQGEQRERQEVLRKVLFPKSTES